MSLKVFGGPPRALPSQGEDYSGGVWCSLCVKWGGRKRWRLTAQAASCVVPKEAGPCWTHQSSRPGGTGPSSPHSLGDVEVLTCGSALPFPRRELRAGSFHPLALCSVRVGVTQGGNQGRLPARAVARSPFPQAAGLCRTPESSQTSRTQASFLGSPLEKVGVLDTRTNPFLSE